MPQVEKEYLALTRDLQTQQLAFEDLRRRLTQAQQTESFESGERGARLVKVRNASLPTSPAAPPRLAIVILGTVLAATLGLGAAVLAELLDGSVRSGRDIKKLGYKGLKTCELVFEDFEVPAENLVGQKEGAGFRYVMSALETGRINVAEVCASAKSRSPALLLKWK